MLLHRRHRLAQSRGIHHTRFVHDVVALDRGAFAGGPDDLRDPAFDLFIRQFLPLAPVGGGGGIVVSHQHDCAQVQFFAAPQVPGLNETGHVEIAVGDALEAVGPVLDKWLAPAMVGVPREDGEKVRFGNVAGGEPVSRLA